MISRRATILICLSICFTYYCTPSGSWSGDVLSGIDVLESNNFAPLGGKRIGLITNHTGINRNWRPTIDILFHAENAELVALFSPEHGIRGKLDAKVPSSADPATGLPIHSLYGDTRRPTKEMLEGIDAMVFDIQDIGARFYTYIGTMKNCMEEAAKHGIEFIVLDRPNPITGTHVEGPILSQEHVFSLAGIHPLPIRHGMTVGELARLFRDDEQMDLRLQVITMQEWNREMWFDQTGLPWLNPSPNMRNLYQAALYPGLGLLERLNVANKRGLERPFEMFGAPWVDALEFSAELNERNIAGVFFTPIKFTPTEHKYAGQPCQGVAIHLTDRNQLHPVALGIHVLHALAKLYPDDFDVDPLWHVTRSEELVRQISDQVPVSSIIESWQSGLDEFMEKREKYLLY